MSFIAELQRRNVFRVVLAYVLASWLLVEVLEVITGAFEAPVWLLKVLISLLMLGVVPVAIFSWIYEITPEGIKKESSDQPEHPAGTAHRLDLTVMVLLAVVVGLLVIKGSGDQAPAPLPVSQTSQITVTAANQGPPMVAVLPFASSSMEGDNNFFANGVHDDLLTQLAKLESIRVISRTSVMEYRETTRNLREIGEALGADAILEGGVQIAGDRLRINAQLISTETDEHLWAETYDRELTTANIFDVQLEIARSIASALNATLTRQDTTQLSLVPTENMAAYRAYHRAMELHSKNAPSSEADRIAALEEAVALDPTFTRAWAELVGALSKGVFYDVEPGLTQRAEQALEKIKAIAPQSADYLFAQAIYIYYVLKDFDQAHKVVSQAVAMNPSDVRVLELRGWIERRQGDYDARTESFRMARSLDPRNDRMTTGLIASLMINHQYNEAMREIEQSPVKAFYIDYVHASLLLQKHGDLQRWQDSIERSNKTREGLFGHQLTWNIRIANRDFYGASQLMAAIREEGWQGELPADWLSGPDRLQLLTYWFLNEDALLAKHLAQIKVPSEQELTGQSSEYLAMAMLAAIQGEMEKSVRLNRRWLRLVENDWVERPASRALSCQIFGMAGATEAAVACIRAGLAEPSWIMPFLEPYLPYYDSIREQPAFIELLAEIEH
jgi:TolB-like protein/Tfp pilus assembly protein PilF